MIQRIQSLFLILNDVIFVVLFFVPFMVIFDNKGEQFGRRFTLADYVPALIGEIVIVVIAGFALVLFKDRKKQMKVCMIGMVISVLYAVGLAAIPFILNGDKSSFSTYQTASGTYIACAHFVLFLLARIFIKRDEDLVQSVDRIR